MIFSFLPLKNTRDYMLNPKRTQYRKYQKGRLKGVKPNTSFLEFGKYGIKSLESGRIKARTIEAVRRVMTRKFKRIGQIWIRVFPSIPITNKPAEVRMGKGKGSVSYWVCGIQKGEILYEMDGIPFQLALSGSELASHKLPLKTEFIHIEGIMGFSR